MQSERSYGELNLVEMRIGVDLIRVATVLESIRCFGSRYLERIYTEKERAYCASSTSEMGRRFAARFAAKEATLKVLRPHLHWLDWRNIEIIKTPAGWCEVHLKGEANRLREQSGILSLSVSLSHETDYAVAVVAATVKRIST
jgi:holo-[acyl-carrier protein] synthase